MSLAAGGGGGGRARFFGEMKGLRFAGEAEEASGGYYSSYCSYSTSSTTTLASSSVGDSGLHNVQTRACVRVSRAVMAAARMVGKRPSCSKGYLSLTSSTS